MTDAGPQIRFTPTQLRIVQLLADGKRHTSDEIHKLLWDETSDKNAIRFHISLARKTLRLIGEDIVCLFDSGFFYQRIKVQSFSSDFPVTKNGYHRA